MAERRFQVSLPSAPVDYGSSGWRTLAYRAKRLVVGLLIAILTVGVVIAAVILGSVIAAIAGVVLLLAVTVGIVRVVLLRIGPHFPQP